MINELGIRTVIEIYRVRKLEYKFKITGTDGY